MLEMSNSERKRGPLPLPESVRKQIWAAYNMPRDRSVEKLAAEIGVGESTFWRVVREFKEASK